MSISNESLPIIAGIITNTARSMTTVMQYIYTVSDSDFYNINIKDVFRIALMDVTDTASYYVQPGGKTSAYFKADRGFSAVG